jgi:formate dehydrogenase accessory protein FdhE
MTISDTDQRVLDALHSAKSHHKELAAYLDFYAHLLREQFTFKAAFVPTPHPHDEAAREQRLAAGEPQLTFEQLGVEAEPLAALAVRLWDIMVSYNPEWAAQREAWSPDEIAALARRAFETRSPFKAPRPSDASPAQALVRMALAPYLQRAAQATLPLLNLEKWRRGYCPACGGQPHFSALRSEGERWLVCSRCSAEWPFARLQCPFCGNADPDTLAYYPDQEGVYRLYVCNACQRYLKTIDLRQVDGRNLMAEPIVTVNMDLAARQEGYR